MIFDGVLYLFDAISMGRGHSETFGKGMVAASKKKNITLKTVCGDRLPMEFSNIYNAVRIFPETVLTHEIYQKPSTHSDKVDEAVRQYVSILEKMNATLTSQDILWDYYLYRPIQLYAYVEWLKGFSSDTRPRLVVNIDVYVDYYADWLQPLAKDIQALKPWLRIASASPTHPKKLKNLLGVPTVHMPRPMEPTKDKIKYDNVIKVGFLGQPSTLTSFDLLPGVAKRCINETQVSFIINCRDIEYEPNCLRAKIELQALSKRFPTRITLHEGYLEHDHYKRIMSSLSGIFVAYDPVSHFENTPSGSVIEGLAVDTFPISIEGTSMVKEMRLFDIETPVATTQTENALVDAVKFLENNHMRLLSENKDALDKWHQFQSYDTLFEKIFVECWE